MYSNRLKSVSAATNKVEVRQEPPLFRLGQIVGTRAVLAFLEKEGVLADLYLNRHARGDWGIVPFEDGRANNVAVIQGGRIISAYLMQNRRVWIITEADRSATTLLFPEEY